MIHGEALVAVAAWSLGAAEVELADVGVGWDHIAGTGAYVVLHDPLCPMTPPEFLAHCVEVAAKRGVVVVGVRPVTDTLKSMLEGELGATVDRDQMVAVCSPIVLPPEVAGSLAGGLPATDFATLTGILRESHDVEFVEAPAAARRVASAEDVRVLAALTK